MISHFLPPEHDSLSLSIFPAIRINEGKQKKSVLKSCYLITIFADIHFWKSKAHFTTSSASDQNKDRRTWIKKKEEKTQDNEWKESSQLLMNCGKR